MGRVAGKTALIHGAWNNEGAAVAKLFALEGANVVLTHNGELNALASVQVIAEEIHTISCQAIISELDVTSTASWTRTLETTLEVYKHIDIWVNILGATSTNRLENESVASWEKTIREYTTGFSLGIQAFIPVFRHRGGSIVNVALTSESLSPRLGNAVVASGGANRILTRNAAVQYAELGIRINSVYVGSLHEENEAGNPTNPIGRLATPKDVAFAVLYLASDEATFVTGSELIIDGGSQAVAKRGVLRVGSR